MGKKKIDEKIYSDAIDIMIDVAYQIYGG